MVLLALVLVALGVFGVLAFLKSRSSFGTVMELPFYSEAEYAYSNGIFYYVDGEKLIRYDPADPDGATSISLGTGSVTVVAENGTAVLYSGSSVQIVGTEQLIDVGGQIISLNCARNHIAILRRDTSGADAVLVYSKEGTLVDIIEQQTDMIIGCGFYSSASSDLMWTLTLSTSATTPVTTLTTYSYTVQGGQTVAATSGVISINSQLVDGVVFTDESIFISGTEQLIRCDAGISGESWRLLTYGYRLEDYSVSSSKPLFLFVPRGEDAMNEVKLYSVSESAQSSATARTVQLDEDIHSVMACGGKMVAFSSNGLCKYSAAGVKGDTFALEFTCVGATKLSESDVLCEAADGSLKLVRLK